MLTIMKASAGSGKTYSLARKYISLLLRNEDRYAYRHILAVTFTNKATDEMKNRILKELHVLAETPAASDYHDCFVPSVFDDDAKLQNKARKVLHDILHDYSAFAVSTIDRFFQQTLKAFSREIGQFASYQVELDKDSLVAESVDRILDSLTEDNVGLLGWLTDNVLEQIEQGGRYSMDANLLDMAVRLKSAQRQEAMEKAGMDEDASYSVENLMKIRQECRNIMDAFPVQVKEKAERILSVFEGTGVSPKDTNRGFLAFLTKYAHMKDGDELPVPTESFMTKAADSSLWFAASKSKLREKVEAYLVAPMEDFVSMWDKEFKVYNTACILDSQIYGLGVAGELQKTYKELMKEKNVLSIDDSNTILRDIIDGSDAPFVYEKTGVRYDHFLLDEFQDTAAVQWTNFSPLLHNSDAQGGENLIVGDVKQSIYRWRGSDWKLLDRKIPEEFPLCREEPLQVNYRSHSNVVRFNNAYFRETAAILDKIDGYEDGGPLSEIYADVEQKVNKSEKDPGNVSLTFCPKDMQLQCVLDAVNQALEMGARLSDIAVLVRSNATGQDVAMFLIDNGITVITDDSLKVKSALTVRRLTALMSHVDNPEDTVEGYLADTFEIRSPKGSMSLVDLAESLLRELKERDTEDSWKGEILHLQSFMDHLQDYVASNGNNLRGFLKHWDGEDPSISSPSAGESVRVMTIHKSKGLDFPYVIIPYAENIKLYKPSSYWCAPELEDTSLAEVADGIYDVTLSKSSENTLFAKHFKEESFLQEVDNINTIYVAMTRAVLGMHIIAQTPSAKCLKSLDDEKPSFADFSQILYWFVSRGKSGLEVLRTEDEEIVRFDIGTMVDFDVYRKTGRSVSAFEITCGDEYPSFALNCDPDEEQGIAADVRGRLRYSEDAAEFFSQESQSGISASNRVRGIVLHDLLAKVRVPGDLDQAVDAELASGTMTTVESKEVRDLLRSRISDAIKLGWFPDDPLKVLNESSIIDVDGQVYRPDRVVDDGGKIMVIDYKFGEHYQKYERQLRKYMQMWKDMGYADVSAYLWYVHTGEIKEVL